MSRWIEASQSKELTAARENLKVAMDAILVEEMSPAAFVEFARFKKVRVYFEEVVSVVDPEMVGHDIWTQIRVHLERAVAHINSYGSTREDNQIFHANNYMDSALSQIISYWSPESVSGAALQKAALDQASSIANASGKIGAINAAINAMRQSAEAELAEVVEIITKIRQGRDIVVGEDGSGGAASEIEQKAKEVKAFHSELLIGNETVQSVKEQIAHIKGEISAQREQISRDQQYVGSLKKNIEDFNSRVYGVSSESGELVGGFNNEFKKLLQALTDFESAQQAKYSALNDQIESLLPGAASAGLASAYKQVKDSFDMPIRNSSYLFYFSIGLLLMMSFLTGIQEISFAGIKFSAAGDWKAVLTGMVHKLPYYIPVLWLAFYSTKRRSEYQRLQQEYAHKEALAKSYDSYRKQVLDLGSDGSSMMAALIEKAISAVAYNASGTLDGKHGEDMPLQKALNKMAEILRDAQQIVGKFGDKGQ